MHNMWVSQIKIIQKNVWLPKWSLINIWLREGDLSFSDLDSPRHDYLGFVKRQAYMSVTLVMTSLFGYAHSVIHIFGCG